MKPLQIMHVIGVIAGVAGVIAFATAILGGVYLAATCVSCLFSSHGFVRLLGALTCVSFVTAYLIHGAAMVSIWCFFAAILSILIYVHLKARGLGGFPGDPLAIKRGDEIGMGQRGELPGASSRRAACQPSV